MTDTDNARLKLDILSFARQSLVETAVLKQNAAQAKGMVGTAAAIAFPTDDEVIKVAEKYRDFILN